MITPDVLEAITWTMTPGVAEAVTWASALVAVVVVICVFITIWTRR
jgi:hypothetical protein